MIKILLSRITREGVLLTGEEPMDLLSDVNDFCFKASGPLKYDLVLSLVNNDVVAKGSAQLDIQCVCGKCLRPYNLKIRNDNVCHFYENPNKNEIDLTEDMREDILISFPCKFECASGCKGLCFRCGQDLNEKECSCSREGRGKNIVWSGLDNLKL